MDKTLNDILEEKRIWIEDNTELRRRLEKFEAQNLKLYDLLEKGEEDALEIIYRNENDIEIIKLMIEDYEDKIRFHRDRLFEYIKQLIKPKSIKYAKPRLKKKYEGHPIEAIAKDIHEMIENRRVPGRKTIRKGRAKYVKINKVQN